MCVVLTVSMHVSIDVAIVGVVGVVMFFRRRR
jgi:hypothetical protein